MVPVDGSEKVLMPGRYSSALHARKQATAVGNEVALSLLVYRRS
jgi:hypothetical protein